MTKRSSNIHRADKFETSEDYGYRFTDNDRMTNRGDLVSQIIFDDDSGNEFTNLYTAGNSMEDIQIDDAKLDQLLPDLTGGYVIEGIIVYDFRTDTIVSYVYRISFTDYEAAVWAHLMYGGKTERIPDQSPY